MALLWKLNLREMFDLLLNSYQLNSDTGTKNLGTCYPADFSGLTVVSLVDKTALCALTHSNLFAFYPSTFFCTDHLK